MIGKTSENGTLFIINHVNHFLPPGPVVAWPRPPPLLSTSLKHSILNLPVLLLSHFVKSRVGKDTFLCI